MKRRDFTKWSVRASATLAVAVIAPFSGAQPQAGSAIRVLAAANLQPALAELVPGFERQQGIKIALTFGASANLVRQIQQGLPADVFLSADEEFADRLVDAGLTIDRGAIYATGRLVLLVPARSSLVLDTRLDGLKTDLPQVAKFALANPELAPYGRAGREALQKQGIWPLLQNKLVMGESIAQATQYVSSGAAEAGITALSLALAPEVAARTRHVVLDESLHAPVRQRMVVLKGAGPGAQAFYAFMQSPETRAVLARYGYR